MQHLLICHAPLPLKVLRHFKVGRAKTLAFSYVPSLFLLAAQWEQRHFVAAHTMHTDNQWSSQDENLHTLVLACLCYDGMVLSLCMIWAKATETRRISPVISMDCYQVPHGLQTAALGSERQQRLKFQPTLQTFPVKLCCHLENTTL